MSVKSTFKLGVTLYSFTTEFWSYKWSFEDCLRKAAELGPNMGVEIVGPQAHRGFPDVPEYFVREFRNSVERLGLIPTSYGAYQDPFFWPDRDFTDDEMLEYMIPQLKGANKMGFQSVRLQYFSHKIAEKLIPYAKKYNLKMGYEVHVPIMIETPIAQMLIEQVKKLSSEYLGLAPDFGIFETGRSGQASSVKPSPPEAIKQIMPYIVHIHGKFHSMVKGEIPAVPFETLTRYLIEGGYTGWMSTEFEGSNLGEYPDSFEIVKLQHALVKRFQAKYAVA